VDKLGRKRRTDPAQESIVAKKDLLNDRVKQLIALWIETKRGWNGRPAPGIGVPEKGDIKLPLPEPVAQAAKAIDGKTDEVLGLLGEVIREQAMYSQTRRKSSREMPVQPTPEAPTEEAPPTTAERAFELKKLATDGMVIEAGRLSRFMAHVKAPFQWEDKKRKQRLRMLRFSANLFYKTKDIENAALAGEDPNKLVYEMKNLYYFIKTNIIDPVIQDLKHDEGIFRPYSSLSTEYSERRRKREKEKLLPTEDTPPSQEMQDLLAKYNSMTADVDGIQKDKNISQDLARMIVFFRAAQQKHDIQEMARLHSDIISAYKNESVLKKSAHNVMSRWLRRQRMNLRETQDSTLRLKIDVGMRGVRSALENLMKVLEVSGDFSTSSIDSLIDMCKALIPALQATTVLAESHNNSIELSSGKKNRYISHSEIMELQNMSGVLYEDMNDLSGLKKPIQEPA
jgi:hypothetical protein